MYSQSYKTQLKDGYRLRITMIVALLRQFGFNGTVVIIHEARCISNEGLYFKSASRPMKRVNLITKS